MYIWLLFHLFIVVTVYPFQSLRILCLVASLVYVHGAIVKRDAGYGSLAPAPANAPIPPPVYGVAPAPPAYGAPPAAYGPVVYYEEVGRRLFASNFPPEFSNRFAFFDWLSWPCPIRKKSINSIGPKERSLD